MQVKPPLMSVGRPKRVQTLITVDQCWVSTQADAYAKAREGYRAEEMGHAQSCGGRRWKKRIIGSIAQEGGCKQTRNHRRLWQRHVQGVQGRGGGA